ncbi:MAG TPA: hypothetical protein VN374_04845 [Desulfitobacteriaceae bacterium]|nr:hypothetical protein [Desulfitobacteriaceae bacterium]
MEDLWQNYSFLTYEMIKFLSRKEWELFFEIMRQREKVQELIDAAPDSAFRQRPEGRKMLEMLSQDNSRIILALQQMIYEMKHKHAISQTYEGGAPAAGKRFDYQG